MGDILISEAIFLRDSQTSSCSNWAPGSSSRYLDAAAVGEGEPPGRRSTPRVPAPAPGPPAYVAPACVHSSNSWGAAGPPLLRQKFIQTLHKTTRSLQRAELLRGHRGRIEMHMRVRLESKGRLCSSTGCGCCSAPWPGRGILASASTRHCVGSRFPVCSIPQR